MVQAVRHPRTPHNAHALDRPHDTYARTQLQESMSDMDSDSELAHEPYQEERAGTNPFDREQKPPPPSASANPFGAAPDDSNPFAADTAPVATQVVSKSQDEAHTNPFAPVPVPVTAPAARPLPKPSLKKPAPAARFRPPAKIPTKSQPAADGQASARAATNLPAAAPTRSGRAPPPAVPAPKNPKNPPTRIRASTSSGRAPPAVPGKQPKLKPTAVRAALFAPTST